MMEILALLIDESFNIQEFSNFISDVLIEKHATASSSNEEPPNKIKRAQNICTFSVKHFAEYINLNDSAKIIKEVFDNETDSEISIVAFKTNGEESILAFGLNPYKNYNGEYLDYLVENVWNNFKLKDKKFNHILLPHEYNEYSNSFMEKLNDWDHRQLYWADQLKNVRFEPVLRPVHFPSQSSNFVERKVLKFQVSEREKLLIDAMCKGLGITSTVVFACVYIILLSRYSGITDMCLLFTCDNDIQVRKPIFLRISITKNMTVKDLLLKINENVSDGIKYYIPKDIIMDPILAIKHEEIFLTTFSYFHFPNFFFQVNKLDINRTNNRAYLSLTILENSTEILGLLEWKSYMFDTKHIDQLIGNFTVLMNETIASVNHSIFTLPILTNEEKLLLSNWNNVSYQFDESVCLHELFENIAIKYPQRTALIDQSRRITYEELDKQATTFAHFLVSQTTCGPEIVIGVCVDKSIELVTCLLAVLKTGSAYVTLDPHFPKERLTNLVHDSVSTVILVQKQYEGLFYKISPTILIDNILSSFHNSSVNSKRAQPNNLAYILFTSGTTGNPKGVMIEHRNSVALIHGMQKIFNSEQEGVLLSASFNFCLFHGLLFFSLSTGYTGILAQTILHVPQLPAKDNITFIANPPAGLFHLIKTREFPASVRTVVIGGDKISIQLILAVKSLPNGTDINIFCSHGCTEMTLFDTIGAIKDVSDENLSVGSPFPGIKLHIVDKNIQRVPLGVIGELCVSGSQISRGYLGNSGQQNDKYLINPFEDDDKTDSKFSRLYRTGDLGRWNMDGTIDLIGRIDNQVKVRAIRIELDEINHAILQHPIIQEVYVILDKFVSQSGELVAYFSLMENCSVSERELRYFLSHRLPNYMIPTHFVRLNQLPRNINGKIDREKLPRSEKIYLRKETTTTELQNATQIKLLSLLKKAFADDSLEMMDNLDRKGLDSITANYLVVLIKMEFQIDIKVEDIFNHPNIMDLNKFLENLISQFIPTLDDFDPMKDSSLTENEIIQIKRHNFSIHCESVKNPKNIFLTGATGFVGAFLLKELLQNTESTIYCLIRASNPAQATERLQTNMNFYQIYDPSYTTRIQCISGDLTKPLFGLNVENYNALSKIIDIIYHCGSRVNFVLPYSALKEDAVFSVKELIMFACKSRLKPFHFISSVAVHETEKQTSNSIIIETFPDAVKNPLKLMGYVRMKWVSEKLIWNAIKWGLPATIYRPSFIVGHTENGAMPPKEFVSRLIKGCIQMKCYPEWDYYLNMIPVDYVTEAILKISSQPSSFGKAYHLTSEPGKEISVWEMFIWINELMNKDYSLSPVPVETWIQKLKRKLSEGEYNDLFPLLQFVEKLSQGGQNIRKKYDDKNTKESLNSNVNKPFVTKSTIRKILQYFKSINFLLPDSK